MKKFSKFLSVLLCLSLLLSLAPAVGAEGSTSATLSFSTKDNRVSYSTTQQVWSQNGITVTNDKASSSSNVADAAAPVKFYAHSKLTIAYTGMTSIEVTCNSTSYANALVSSITDSNATVSSSEAVVTIAFATAVDSFVIADLSAQVRVDSITVYSESTDSEHEHDYTGVTPTVAVVDGVNHIYSYTCTDPDCDYVKTGTEAHTPGADGKCTVCGFEYTGISQILAAAKGTWTATGVVTMVDGRNVYIQDSTGGICLYCSTAPEGLFVGDVVTGTGTYTTYKGLPELSDVASVTKVEDSDLTLTAKLTTIDALLTSDVCTYVSLKAVEIDEIYDNNGAYSNPNITVKDADGNKIQIYKAVIGKNEDNSWAFAVGDIIDVTAAVGISNTTLQLRNTTADEISLHEHEDADKNHKCDICGATCSEHIDVDPADHYCDICSAKMSDHEYATTYTKDDTGHWYACSGCSAKKDFAEHSFVNGVCTVCGYQDHEHVYGPATCTKPATCTVEGCSATQGEALGHKDENHDHVCDVCGEKASDHNLNKVNAKEATQEAEGNKEYWVCETCGKLFADSEGKTETTLDAVTLPKLPASSSCVFTKVTTLSDLVPGSYVVVAQYDGKYYMMTYEVNSSNKLVAIEVTVDGTTISGSDLPVWTLAATKSGVSLSNGTKFLAHSGSTNLKLDDTAFTWTLNAKDPDDGSYKFIPTGADTRGLSFRMYKGDPIFGTYALSNETNETYSKEYSMNLMFFKLTSGDPGSGSGSGSGGNGGSNPGTTPSTPKEILDAAYALGTGESLEGTYSLTGVITEINTPYSEQYQNITVTIQVGEYKDQPIQCYRLKGEGADTLAVGDTITVTGQLKNYNGTVEFNSGCTVSDIVKGSNPGGGSGDNGGSGDSTGKDIVSISTALAGEKGTVYTVKGVVNMVDGKNVYIQDSTGGICIYFSSSDHGIKVTDTIIATGKLDNYNGLPELASATFEKSEGLHLSASKKTIDSLTTADVCTYINLNGVKIVEIYDNDGQYTNPNITVEDANGNQIQVYKAVLGKNADGSWAFKVGDTVNLNAAVSIYKDTLQLRNTYASEIVDSSSVPATGDASMISVFVALMAVTGLGLTAVVAKKKEF
ncbi:MAG: hypothetical protein ACI4PO_06350 [Faecousia sp.]